MGETVSRTFLLQDWVTIRSSGAQIIQDQEEWLDLEGFSEAAGWIDVTEVTPPGGTSTNSLQVAIESSPSSDEVNFIATTLQASILACALPFNVAASTPFVVRSMSLGGYPVTKYLRWRIIPNTSSAWDLTFRIRIVATRSSLTFVPTQVSGLLSLVAVATWESR